MNNLCEFLDRSVTPFHAVSEIEAILKANGFLALAEHEDFSLVRGGKYYVTRGASSLIAFCMAQEDFVSFQMASAHSDSPCFRVKETEDRASSYTRLGVEMYGGTLCTTWFDRPLSVAGRVYARQDGMIKEYKVNFNKEKVVIPSLAIHLNREANTAKPLVDAKSDLLPLVGSAESDSLMDKLYTSLDLCAEDLLSSDLYLYAAEPAFVWCDGKYITSPRLDDLMCVYGLLKGFINARAKSAVSVLAIFDNEEVGSRTRHGADSSFLEDTLARISESMGKSAAEHKKSLASSFMISADNAHAVHPNHPELSDKDGGRVYMNGGVVIKHNAQAKYTTDAFSQALLVDLCQQNKIPYQHYYNRADLPGGSTLGNISCSHVSVPSIDIGLAQLAMHSAVETAGALDVEYLSQLAEKYFSSTLVTEKGAWYWKN